MRLLVTGGSGFIGSNFIRYSLTKHPDLYITNLDVLTYAGNQESTLDFAGHPRYQFVHGDITNRAQVDEVMRGVDAVINFAAESHVDRSIHSAAQFIHTNIVGTHTLLESARLQGNIRFHQVSTDEVFGMLTPLEPAFTERTPYQPRSPYSASKASADLLTLAYFHTYGLPVTISNCSNNYGPYQFPEKLHALCITNALENAPLPIYGDGQQIRDWLYVDDHCRALDLILWQGKMGEQYCIGGNQEKTNLEIAKIILNLLGKDESLITHVTDRLGHDRRYAIDNTKLTNALGWKPEVDFVEGMKRTVAWYQQNESWWKKLKGAHL